MDLLVLCRKETKIMVSSCIFSFLIEPVDRDKAFALYQFANRIVERSIVKSEFKGKCRISLGNMKFLDSNKVSHSDDIWLHIIVTGRDIKAFSEVFKKTVEITSFLPILNEISGKGNAFTHHNDRIMKLMCAKDTVLKSGKRKQSRITEKKVTNYVL